MDSGRCEEEGAKQAKERREREREGREAGGGKHR